MIGINDTWGVFNLSVEDFLTGMSELGTPQEIQMVGSFADPNDETVRTAHRDIDLPPHRDGIYTKAIADMQGGMYVEKPNVDIVGMYCVRDNQGEGHHLEKAHFPCYTVFYEDEAGTNELGRVDLYPGQAVIWKNNLWHGRRGAVGTRLLIRFWVTCPELRA